MTNATLVNKETGLRIEGDIESWSGQYIKFKVDGTSRWNEFIALEWDVEFNRPKLPTKLGSVVQITKWAGRDVSALDGYRAMLTHGGWRIATDRDLAYKPEYLDGKPVNDFQWKELL